MDQLAALIQQQQQQISDLHQQLGLLQQAQQQHLPPPMPQPQSKDGQPAKPEKFKATSSELPQAADWIFQLHIYFEACNTTPARRLLLAPTFLAEHALRWWRSIPQAQQPTTWEEFQQAFVAQFVPKSTVLAARERLSRYVQHKSARQYTEGFRQLILQVPDISPSEALDRYKRGLKSSVRVLVELAEPATWEDAAIKAEGVDSIQFMTRSTATPSNNYRHPSSSGPSPMELGAIGQQRKFSPPFKDPNKLRQREEDIRKNQCFFCHRHGHVALACPQLGRTSNHKPSSSSENWRRQ